MEWAIVDKKGYVEKIIEEEGTVIVENDDGVHQYYVNLNQVFVEDGQDLYVNQVIGAWVDYPDYN